MEFKDIKIWIVTDDHKATPKNHFSSNPTITAQEMEFEQFIRKHVYDCSPSLVVGEHSANDVELIWQEKIDWWANVSKRCYERFNNQFDAFQKYWLFRQTRQYLQLKNTVKSAPNCFIDCGCIDEKNCDKIKSESKKAENIPIQSVIEVLKYMCGYTDFPQRKEGEGAYYWRKILRNKFEEIGVKFR